ncbi:MAG: transporter substrate-binding protein [Hyphomicrobiales bacterium]|nr:transporter substrate-binding protein [Hyphomicrobiales bacterium]
MTERLVVNCNPTAKSLPLRAGLKLGLFARRAISLELVSTENSREQREGLASGAFHIVHVAIDNAVALRDVAGVDVVVFMGGDAGMNELIVQPGIDALEQMRGGRLVVDAPDTAFAFQAYRMFAQVGLERDVDYTVVAVGRGELRIKAMLDDRANTASVLNLPYTLEAKAVGLKSFGDTTDFIGPYQAGSAFALRDWADANRDLVTRYIAAYIECLTFVLDAANHDACVAILTDELGTQADVASECVRLLRLDRYGLDPLAVIDEAGFANTLELRRHFGAGVTPGRPSDYVDSSFHRAAQELLRSGALR